MTEEMTIDELKKIFPSVARQKFHDDQWISVKDKLPDEYPVLVLDSHGSMCVIHDSATTYSNCCGCHFGEYSHWMQLPTPPEENNNG